LKEFCLASSPQVDDNEPNQKWARTENDPVGIDDDLDGVIKISKATILPLMFTL
jgi:hypothetical protein